MPERTTTTVEGRRLVLSHLDKVLWPATGTTKAEALHYYAEIAPAMLPHLRGRPASFLRFPDGVGADRFYIKNLPPGLPDWVPTVEVPSSEGPRRQVAVDDLPSLMAMANLGALEIHVPQWTRAGADAHDRLVVDLDPGPGIGVVDCCRVALLVREALAADGLDTWAKTSGSKGLHLYARLPGATGREASGYAKGIAQRLENDHPQLITHRMTKSLRPGRVFVDWSQNATAKTTAAPYTLRARDRPTVSTPLTWDEVESCHSPGDVDFTPEDVLSRAAEHGDLMAGLASTP